MNEDALRISWPKPARAALRAIDRTVAMDILLCLTRFLDTREGDVKKLRPPETGFRLRCGDYRVVFDFLSPDAIEILDVDHRRQVYR